MKSRFPNSADFAFYQSRQRAPQWAEQWVLRSRVEVDSVVNAHACIRPTSGEVAAQNLMLLIRGVERRRGNVEEFLSSVALNPMCAISPQRRAGFARKWARRIRRVEGRSLPNLAY